MKTGLLSTIAAVALTLGLVTGAASGQEDKKPIPVAKDDKAAAAQTKLTDESLLAMLEKMGYAPTTEKAGASTIYCVQITKQGTPYNVTVQVGPDQKKIWVMVPLIDMPKDSKIASDHLLKLLELNHQITPCYFHVVTANNRLFMTRNFDNQGVTAAVLRDVLDRTMDHITQTRTAWNVKNWSEPVTVQK